MKRLLFCLSGFFVAGVALAKVHHNYVVEICDAAEERCAVLSAQDQEIGFITTEKDASFVEGVPVVIVSEEFYASIAADLERHSIEDYVEEEENDDDIFLEAKGGGKAKNVKRLYKALQDMFEKGGGGGGGGSSRGKGKGNKSEGGKTCGKCHTDGKHSHHPPT